MLIIRFVNYGEIPIQGIVYLELVSLHNFKQNKHAQNKDYGYDYGLNFQGFFFWKFSYESGWGNGIKVRAHSTVQPFSLMYNTVCLLYGGHKVCAPTLHVACSWRRNGYDGDGMAWVWRGLAKAPPDRLYHL